MKKNYTVIAAIIIFIVTGTAAFLSLKQEPQKVTAEGCVIQSGLKCLALDLHPDRMRIYIENQLDKDIIIQNIRTSSLNTRCEIGDTALAFYRNKVLNFNLNCMPPLLKQVGKIRFDVVILYNSDDSPETKQIIGEIQAGVI